MLGRRRPLDEAFAAWLDGAEFAARDGAFVRHLVTTTLRRLGQIDALIDHCLARPLPERAHTTRNILRLGACQLVFLQTPPHAAVDTSVALARRRRQGHHLALINAVLRRLASEGRTLAAEQDAPRLNTPEWLWRSWSEAYGAETCRNIAAAHLRQPPLDLTARGSAAQLADSLGAALLPTGSVRLDHHGPITDLPGFAEGAWWVQDAAAALPARLLGEVRGRRVIDLCAAPGGKTAQLAAAGAEVIAVDRAAARLRRVEENLSRLRLAAELVHADALRWRPPAPADAVLVDAPCSATGTIRRRPDVVWTKSAADVAALAALQSRLIGAAAAMLRPGGVLIYCACSLQPEEGPEQRASALGAGIGLRPEAISAAEIGGLAECVTAAGELRTLPCHLAERGGMDGFYAVRFRAR